MPTFVDTPQVGFQEKASNKRAFKKLPPKFDRQEKLTPLGGVAVWERSHVVLHHK
jgi:hypothetical protein